MHLNNGKYTRRSRYARTHARKKQKQQNDSVTCFSFLSCGVEAPRWTTRTFSRWAGGKTSELLVEDLLRRVTTKGKERRHDRIDFVWRVCFVRTSVYTCVRARVRTYVRTYVLRRVHFPLYNGSCYSFVLGHYHHPCIVWVCAVYTSIKNHSSNTSTFFMQGIVGSQATAVALFETTRSRKNYRFETACTVS